MKILMKITGTIDQCTPKEPCPCGLICGGAHGKVKKLLMSYFEYEPSGIDEMEIVPFYLNIAVLRSGKVLSPRILRLMSEHT